MMFNKNADKYYLLVELFYYSMVGDDKMLEQVLFQDGMQGVSLEESDKDGQTPLMAAVTAGNYSTTLLLVQYGADVNAIDHDTMDKPDKGTPLRRAVDRGYLGIAGLLLMNGADPNLRRPDNMSVLMWAVGRRNHAMVDLLLDHGADVNAIQNDADSGETALSKAAYGGDLVLVRRLLDVRAQLADSPTALIWAGVDNCYLQDQLEDYKSIVRLLLQEGADINAQDVYGKTALMMASGATTCPSAPAVQFLLEQGAEVNIKAQSGDSALGFAASNGNARAVRLLLAAGARVNDPDDAGRTPLMWAIRDANREVVQILLAAGADAGCIDEEGETAADRAEELDDPEEKMAVLSLLQREALKKEKVIYT